LKEGQELAAEARANKPERKEVKTEQVKERRQRRQIKKNVRVKDQAKNDAVVETEVEVVLKQQTVIETKKPEAKVEEQETKQRRNRRSPRHLRASGQRRRRGRDRKPNPFRLRNGGVASPEMAMGKVMPRYDLAKPKYRKEENVEKRTETNTPVYGGYSFPEMAMGKVILRREELVAEFKEQPVNQSDVKESTQPIDYKEQDEQVTLIETSAETVKKTVQDDTAKVEEIIAPESTLPIGETDKADIQTDGEVKVETETETETETEVIQEVSTQTPITVNVSHKVKSHVSSPMAKAPGNEELREIEIVVAPLKTERFQPVGAGSIAAKNQASSEMAKTGNY
jgi:ribonuclease E